MGRKIAACFGCLLMLSSSCTFAASGAAAASPSPAAAAPGASAPPTVASTTAASSPAGASGVPLYGYSGSSLLGSLPDLGGPAYGMIPRADESTIGHMIVKQVRDANLLLEDPEITDYLQQVGMRLASQAHDEKQIFEYHCMRDPEIQATSMLGGQIFINAGLILATNNEGELASVIAHETGHVVQRHMERAIQAQSRMSLASTAAMLAGILLAAAARSSVGGIEGAVAMGQAMALQQQINYTRTQEVEADYVGIQLMAGAGYDPNEVAAFFETLQRQYGMELSEIPALLQNHPVTVERIASARARAREFPRPRSSPQSPSYEFIKERVRVLSAAPDARIGQYYASLSRRRALTPAERYGQALVQVQSGAAAAAVPTLRELQARYPDLVMLYSALGQALDAAGRQSESLALFANAERLFPRNAPLTVHYGETLMRAGQPGQAHQLLLDLFNSVEPTPAQIWLTAQAANAADDAGDAYYYMCEYNLENGDLALAHQQLELALAAPRLTAVQRERFRARLLQVREWMREQQQSSRGS